MGRTAFFPILQINFYHYFSSTPDPQSPGDDGRETNKFKFRT